MADDDTKVSSDTPPEEEHVEEEPEAAPSDDETYAEEEEVEQSPQSTTAEDLEKRFERLSKKMGELERERNEFAPLAAQWSALNEQAVKDPEFALLANQKLLDAGVISQEQFDQLKGRLSPKKGETPKDTGLAEPKEVTPVNPDPAIEWARRKQMEEEAENIAFFKRFSEKHPDVDDTTPDLAVLNRKEIIATAQRLMVQGASKEEAFETAYNKWAGKAEEDAELQGIAKARAANPALGSASGSAEGRSQSVQLTEEQLDAAERLGLTAEEYAAGLDPDYGSNLKI